MKAKEYFNVLNEFRKQEVKNTNVGNLSAAAIGVFLIGLIFGWMILGWLIWPVQWEPNAMNTMTYESKVIVVDTLSEHYALTTDESTVYRYIMGMNDIDSVACAMSDNESDLAKKARYITIAYLKNGYGCQ